MNRSSSLAGAAVLLGLSALAAAPVMAAEPEELTLAQMDKVTAGWGLRTELSGSAFTDASASSHDGSSVTARSGGSVVIANGNIDTEASAEAYGQQIAGVARTQANRQRFYHDKLVVNDFVITFADFFGQGDGVYGWVATGGGL